MNLTVAISSLLGMAFATAAAAHSASDAYLTISAEKNGKAALHGQWDIALRDLDFAIGIDDDGDGHLTWGEVAAHQAAIAAYVYRHLRIDAGAGNRCMLKPRNQLIDEHADGMYAALFFDVQCEHEPQKITVSYSLFFAMDPSHRGIFVMHHGDDIATAVFSPQSPAVDLPMR